ncbi:hypothetical protein WH47_02390 [Habropoda laboriosa]|uniref:Histone-lysine N-methyltransferase SETMAR n=1 Tax=Habropoda laboriosa TaxID=597456 RepID=A0A0L7R006_9HYME|nr:hypothetical protein WH47_02390 [Habropoda laboriosa]
MRKVNIVNRVKRVRPEIALPWILHHNNTSVQPAILVKQFTKIKIVYNVGTPPYSSDLFPCDSFYFLE